MDFDLKLPANIIVAGASGSGKTTFIKNVLLPKIKPQYDKLIICSSTLSINHDFDNFKEDNNKIYKVEDDIEETVMEIIDNQKYFYKLYNQGLLKEKQIPRIVILLDDLCNSRIFSPNGFLTKWSIKTRHYKISLIITTQRIAAIGRQLRVNCAILVCFSVMAFTELERIILECVSKKYHKKMTDILLDIYSKDYNYLISNNREQNIKKRIWKNGTELIEFE